MQNRYPNCTSIESVIRQHTGRDPNQLESPERPPITNLAEMVTKLQSYKTTGKTVRIISDYDMDGISSGIIMSECLTEYFGRKVTCRPPKRFSEGYGMNNGMVDETTEDVIITIDNGIAAIDAIDYAVRSGKEVCVIDHHHMRDDEKLPQASIIIDPHVTGGYNGYCAAGLALRLAEILVPTSTRLMHWRALAAIATVADVVPLIGDNHRIVREGIEILRNNQAGIGLQRLLSLLRIEKVTEMDIGYAIAPCCNAAGRLLDNGAEFVIDILSTNIDAMDWGYDDKIRRLDGKIYRLIDLNENRKKVVQDDMNIIMARLTNHPLHRPLVIDVTNGDTRQAGWVGILAGKIAEIIKAPVICLTEVPNNPELLKGSGRSYGNINLKKMLDVASLLLEQYGGHAGAAGLTVKKTNLRELEDTLVANVPLITDVEDTVWYDMDVSEDQYPRLLETLNHYSPYGEGNPVPLFHTTVRLIPKNGKYWDYIGVDSVICHGNLCDYVAFHARKSFENMPKTTTAIEVVGSLSEHVYRGESDLRFLIQEVKPLRNTQTTTNEFRQALMERLKQM